VLNSPEVMGFMTEYPIEEWIRVMNRQKASKLKEEQTRKNVSLFTALTL